MDHAVWGNLKHLFQDEDARAKMVRLGTSIVKHTTEEGLNFIPGYKVVARSLRDLNGSDETEVDLKVLRADVRRLEKEFNEYKKEVDELQVEVKALAAHQLRLEKQLCEYRINKVTIFFSKSLHDVKESDNQTSQKESDKEKVHLEAVQADLDGLKKEFSEYRKLHKQEEIDKPCADMKPTDKIRSKM